MLGVRDSSGKLYLLSAKASFVLPFSFIWAAACRKEMEASKTGGMKHRKGEVGIVPGVGVRRATGEQFTRRWWRCSSVVPPSAWPSLHFFCTQ